MQIQRILTCFALLALLATSLQAAPLVDYWRFDNNGNNSGTSGRVGTLEGDAGFSNAQVAPGAGSSHSLQVDGDTDAYILNSAIDRTNLSNLLEGNSSISFWARSDVSAADVGSGSIGYMFDFGEGHGSGIGAGFIDNHGIGGNNSDAISGYYTNNGFGDTGVAGNADQWYHVAMTRDGNLVSLYIDGALAATTNEASPNINTGRPFSIGRQAKSIDREWEGFLDEFGIFSEALSAEEVSLINDVARNSGLDYDLDELNQLFELHDSGDSSATVVLDDLIWTYFVDDNGTFAGLGIGDGEFGTDGTQSFLNFGNGTGLATLLIPEPVSIAIWSLFGLGLAGFGYGRTRRKK